MSRCRLEPGSDVLGGAGSRAAVVIVWCVMWTVSTLIPAEGLSGISKNTTCESDFYFDHGTDSCEHCCDICCNAEQAGVEDQCESLCGAYDPKMREEYEAAKKKKNDAQQKSAIEMEIPSRRSTSSDTSNASMPVGAQVAIYVACVASLVTLFVLVFVKRKTIVSKCRRGGVSDQQDPESAVPLQPQQDSSTVLEMVVVGAVCREAHSTRTQPQMNISPALELATAGGTVCGADQCSTVLQPQTLQLKTPIQVTQDESLRSWSLPDLLDHSLISETGEEQNTELKTFLRGQF